MKLSLALLSLPCLAAGLTASAEDVAHLAFDSFKSQYNKKYVSEVEEAKRYEAFKASLDRVAASGNPTHGITKFSDMTPEEFKATYLSARPLQKSSPPVAEWDGECTACKRFPELSNLKNATSFDWTTKGAVTKVKNQGQCGSCWSFGTTGDIEGTWFLAGNDLTSLSEQELVSCDKTDDGCGGGLQETAFAWVIKQGGLTTEANYPYNSGGGRVDACEEAKKKPIAASIKTWYQVSKNAGGESKIESQLPHVGPITIGINATPMQDYKGGVDNPRLCSGLQLDHAVLIVGFGTDNGVDYWKIKNSWAADWGEEGYYRIVRGHNKCGLANDAVHSVAGK